VKQNNQVPIKSTPVPTRAPVPTKITSQTKAPPAPPVKMLHGRPLIGRIPPPPPIRPELLGKGPPKLAVISTPKI
jgi:hypothetical protein